MKILGVSPIRQKLEWYFFGIRLLKDEKYTLQCPRCNSKMKKIQKQTSIIDMCPYCGGIFLDHGEINKLASLTKKQKPEVKKNGKKK